MNKKSHKIEDKFSDFFYNAPKGEQMAVFTEAAKNANKDQRALVKEANLRLRNSYLQDSV